MSARQAVGVRQCSPEATDREVRDALFAAAAELGDLSRLFAGKRKVLVKPNIGTDDVRRHRGRQVALTDPAVLRATLELIRQSYDGEIVIGEATTGSPCREIYDRVGHRLDDIGARVVDLKDGPFVTLPLPGGLMFDRYVMAAEYADADMIVSVAKMKSHLSTGATLCLKNLFGMTPTAPYGSPRRYLHAPVRLPRVLVDVALLHPPELCVVDGLVGQSGQEWHGEPNEPGVILVGTNVVATDAAAMRMMGFDPEQDFGEYPYLFDRNPIRLAAEAGLGSPAANDIDIRGDASFLYAAPFSVNRQPSDTVARVRMDVARQIDWYRSHRHELCSRHQGKYLAIAGESVIAVAETVDDLGGRGALAERASAGGILVKRADIAEREDERLEVYDRL